MGTNTFREPPVAGDEPDVLLGILDRTRSVLAWKCGGVDDAGMRATVGASSVTLAGLLKHLAFVEDYYFSYKLFGRDSGRPGPMPTRERSTAPSRQLRRLVADLIDEYARHNGHADLIRESIDGLVGEDPPITVEP